MLAKDKPLGKIGYGLAIDIRPVFFQVILDEPCPEHGKPIHFITTVEGIAPYNNCIECIIELMTGLSEVCEEYTVAKRAIGG